MIVENLLLLFWILWFLRLFILGYLWFMDTCPCSEHLDTIFIVSFLVIGYFFSLLDTLFLDTNGYECSSLTLISSCYTVTRCDTLPNFRIQNSCSSLTLDKLHWAQTSSIYIIASSF